MPRSADFHHLSHRLRRVPSEVISGRIAAVGESLVEVEGLSRLLCLGDRLSLYSSCGKRIGAETVSLGPAKALVFPEGRTEGFAVGDRAVFVGQSSIAPDLSWAGRVLDAFGDPLDGNDLARGANFYPLRRSAPPAMNRGSLGARLETGLAVLNTFLPIVRGQRVGLFAGSGVGKTTLLGKLARKLSADVVVLALIGERGREVRDFVDRVLGPEAMKRCVVVAATSDQSPAVKRRAAFTGMAIAECFRDAGAHVVFMADSITRLAEAHREVAVASGELATLRGFPPSTAKLIMELAERAGPGPQGGGEITGVFNVLVAGSDFDEPVADILRGTLDGHVVLSREIASRGRFPAIDVLNSVSRSLPQAADSRENEVLDKARQLLAAYERARLMIEAGLYATGTDPQIDKAMRVHDDLERFLARVESQDIKESFRRLSELVA